MSKSFKLISYKTCPYVQRTAIVLLEKNIHFETVYIDIKHKPEWFLAISPLGKVPILKVNNEALFESAIINEYLDETHPPSMHPADPLLRALNRAWIEFGSELIMDLVILMRSETEQSFHDNKKQCTQKLVQLEKILNANPFFNGKQFCLIDAAYAPFFIRLTAIESFTQIGLLENFPKIKGWSEQLLKRFSVQQSVVAEFPQLLLKSIKSRKNYVSEHLVAG